MNQKMNGMVMTGVLADGTAVAHDTKNYPIPCTVWVEPVAGDTVNVWFSRDGGVTYYEWPNGAVTSASAEEEKYLVLNSGITNLKFQRTAGSGTTSTYGVC